MSAVAVLAAPAQERPASRHPPTPATPELGGESSLLAADLRWVARLDVADPGSRAAAVLALQRTAGNAAVQRLLGPARAARPVQRDCGCSGGCGGCGDKEEGGEQQESGEQPGLLPVARQVPPVYIPPSTTPGTGPVTPPSAAPVPCVLVGATLVDRVIDGFTRGTPECLFEAWGQLNVRAMFDLLPALQELKNKGQWAAVTADAAFRGGPRMELAVHAVNLKTQGTPITPEQLRDLIDRLATMWADQRADILRFIGKYVMITVDGIDLDSSFVAGATSASCAKEVQDTITEAKFFIKEYAACGADSLRNTTGAQIEACVTASLARQGFGVSVAGSTSSTGAITITPTAVTKCQPIMTRNTEIHESVHQHHTKALEKKLGKGTPAFKAAFNEAQDWVRDEINARKAEITFLTKVLAALKKLEKMVK